MHVIPHSKPSIDESDVNAVTRVLRSGHIAQGEEVEEFESAVAHFLQKKHAVALSSGTSALHLTLLSVQPHGGSQVAIPSYTCSSLLHAVEHARAAPLLIDIQEEGFGMDPQSLRTLSGRRSEIATAIIPHMFGRIVDLDEIRSSTEIGCIVEDAAMAIGHPDVGKGDAVVCSFYATKMMTTGEGGMVLSNDEELIDRIRDIRDYDKKQTHRPRYNYKMTDFQAALGLSQLSRLPQFLKRREEISARYGNRQRACYRYVARSKTLDRDLQAFRRRNIECGKPVYKPIHEYLGLADRDYPRTSRAMSEALSIPIYPLLSDDEVEYVAEAIKDIL